MKHKPNPQLAGRLASWAMMLGVAMLGLHFVLVLMPGEQHEDLFAVTGVMLIAFMGAQYLRMYMNGDLERIADEESRQDACGPSK